MASKTGLWLLLGLAAAGGLLLLSQKKPEPSQAGNNQVNLTRGQFTLR